MGKTIGERLEFIKNYREENTLESDIAFKTIFESIVNEIPEPYKSKLLILEIITEIQISNEDDLPF